VTIGFWSNQREAAADEVSKSVIVSFFDGKILFQSLHAKRLWALMLKPPMSSAQIMRMLGFPALLRRSVGGGWVRRLGQAHDAGERRHTGNQRLAATYEVGLSSHFLVFCWVRDCPLLL
jgi:hypothetical protein